MDFADTVSDMVTECFLIGACELKKERCLECPDNNAISPMMVVPTSQMYTG
jgi:hypothetical protein